MLYHIDIDLLVPYSISLFKPYTGEKLNVMVKSVKERGVLEPIIVRELNSVYEILSGHNRVIAARIVGMQSVPTIIMENITDLEANIIVTESNLIQRSFADLTHSEKAAVISIRHKGLCRQGLRSDLIDELDRLANYDDSKRKRFRTDLTIADEFGLSKSSVARYVRLNYLSGYLKERVDDGSISFRAGVDLSYLKEEEQLELEEILDTEYTVIPVQKSKRLRNLSKEFKINREDIKSVLEGPVFSKRRIVLPNEVVDRYFQPNLSQVEVRSLIIKAIENYFR